MYILPSDSYTSFCRTYIRSSFPAAILDKTNRPAYAGSSDIHLPASASCITEKERFPLPTRIIVNREIATSSTIMQQDTALEKKLDAYLMQTGIKDKARARLLIQQHFAAHVSEYPLEGRGGPVYVRVEDFSGNWLELRKREKTQEKCPSQVTGKAESKYTTYRLIERYLENGEMVAVQGRLTRNADGRLFIKPTKRLEFPSFVVVKERLDQLTGTLAAQADHKVWVQRINAGFLVINALVLCSLWQ